jgi:WD40 repeat protein
MKRFPALIVLGCFLCAAPRTLADKEKELLKTKASRACLTPDGKVLIASGNNNTRLINIADKKSNLLKKSETKKILLSGDGKTLALVNDNDVALYDVALGKEIKSLTLPKDDVHLGLSLGSDGKTLAYGITNQDLVLFDTAGAKVKHAFKNQREQPWQTAFSPDGKYLACGYSSNGMFSLFDITENKLVRELKGLPAEKDEPVMDPTFSGDSKLVAATCKGVLKVWEVGSGKEVGSFKDDAKFYAIALSKDGKLLVSGNGKGVVTLWDLANNKPFDTIKFDKYIERVTLSSDAKILSVTVDVFAVETRVYDISAAVAP